MSTSTTKDRPTADFPWHLGIRDAHCHPTDVMASIDRMAGMKAEVLTVMATRWEDQGLVEGVAAEMGEGTGVVPAFGWHPWFSYQMVDDRDEGEDGDGDRSAEGMNTVDAMEHYTSVLRPRPSPSTSTEDHEFLAHLPVPVSLSTFLRETEIRLRKFPHALIGEVGLDKGFRIPLHYDDKRHGDDTSNQGRKDKDNDVPTPGVREGRTLSRYHVSMAHQKVVLRAQLELAAKLSRAVSLHSVQAHGVTAELLQEMWKGHERPSKRKTKREKHHADRGGAAVAEMDGVSSDSTNADQSPPPPYPPRICMHSYSGSLATAKLLVSATNPTTIFFSFSQLMNFGDRSAAHTLEVVHAIPADRILIESDMNAAGEEMDRVLEMGARRICQVKGWEVEEGLKILRRNWETFVYGDEGLQGTRGE